MRTADATLDVDGASYPGRVNAPDGPMDHGVLVVPGAGHGPFGDVFDRVAEAAAEQGRTVARFETWESHEELRRKTDAEFEAELEEGVEFLRERGCASVAVVAKSFGGRLALTHLPGRVDRLVLWAPAAAFGESEEHPSITDTQRSIIEGELLGDACIYRRHETACHFKLESTTKAHPAHVRTHLPRGVFPNTQPYSLDRQTK